MSDLTKLGRYKLGRVLGRGAMGVVYEGLDPSLNRRVAIKTILKNAAIDAETAQMYSAQFAREAQAAGRLNHPNIVQVHDFAEEGEIAYLVMEFIQGRELRSYFEAKETFEPAEAVRIMGELLDALDLAHEAGVIHRDIKPANVMLDAQRRVKLADFGVARIQDSERSAAGTMVGTPAFMSPEQIQGGKIDRRTDLFSAGVVLYQLLTGEQPFTGAGAWTVAKKIMQDDPPRPSSVTVSVSPVFDGIVNKALAKNPAERFSSAKEFATALRGALTTSAPSAAAPPAPKPKGAAVPKASEAEVEFWRAIQNSTDPAEIEFYLEQFPDGTYAQLARHKIAKLREPAGAARRESEETVRLEAQARARREAEEQARQEAEEQARREAEEQARREAEARAAREAEERARVEAEDRAAREAQERARREAEEQAKRAAEAAARKEAEASARREAEDKAKRDAEARAKQLAAEKAKRDAEESARKAQALARLKQLEQAAARSKAVVDEDATVAIGSARTAATPPAPPAAQKKPVAIPAMAAAAVIVAGIGAYVLFGRSPAPAPAPVAETPPAQKTTTQPAAPAIDVAKIQRETEERVRKEFADKAAGEKAAMEKAVAEKAAVEKAAAEKLAQAKTAVEKAAAEKAMSTAAAERVVAEKAASDKAAQAKAAADKTAADKTVADKAGAEKSAAEKEATEKASAEKMAAEKAVAAKVAVAARKPGWPAVGDRWIYEAREMNRPEKRQEIQVEMQSVSATGMRDAFKSSTGTQFAHLHRSGAYVLGGGPGIFMFSPYLRAFQEIREGEAWSNVEFERLGGCSTNPQLICTLSARVVGREKVTVKAGSFDTWKIVVENRARSGGPSSLFEYTFWFAEDARRFVKAQSRMRSGSGSPVPETDMELVSYVPADAGK
jgi:serine/threonine-protein kinase